MELINAIFFGVVFIVSLSLLSISLVYAAIMLADFVRSLSIDVTPSDSILLWYGVNERRYIILKK